MVDVFNGLEQTLLATLRVSNTALSAVEEQLEKPAFVP